MTEIAEAIFLVSIILIFYTYLGYPLLLLILNQLKKIFKKKHTHNGATLLPVTLIVAAYNEEEIIEEKIKNTIDLSYPSSLLKVIFITDGSTDNTVQIIKRYPQFKLLHEAVRRGKVAAMNRAIKYVDTEIVVFSDANGFLNKDCLQALIKRFDSPAVAAVTGEKKVLKNRHGAVGEGEGLYWKYESFLKKLDSEFYTVVGAAGELFSIRTNLYVPLPETIIIEDFVQSLQLCVNGYIVKYEPAAWSQELASYTIKDEMERKVRISAGAFQAMVYLKELFNVFRYPVLFFQYFSHRVLRWTLTPLSLPVLFAASIYLYWSTGTPFYASATLLQLIFYIGAILGWKSALINRKHTLFYLPFYFVFMNLCVFTGFFRYLSRRQETIWKKAARS